VAAAAEVARAAAVGKVDKALQQLAFVVDSEIYPVRFGV
jgi:hypothetical protein